MKWYKVHTCFLEDDYDPSDRIKAFERSLEWEEKIPLGLFYQKERPTIEDKLPPVDKEYLATMSFLSDKDIDNELGLFY